MNRAIASTHLTVARMSAAMRRRAGNDRHCSSGATAVEYALIIAAIMVVIVVAVVLLGKGTSGLFNKAATGVPSV